MLCLDNNIELMCFDVDPVLRLVEAEVEFELYLHEHEPRQCNVAVAQKALTSMKKIFQDLQKAECKSTLVC